VDVSVHGVSVGSVALSFTDLGFVNALLPPLLLLYALLHALLCAP
jgi:hypothetical protein